MTASRAQTGFLRNVLPVQFMHWSRYLRHAPILLLLLGAVGFSTINHQRSVDFAESLRQLRDLERTSSALFFAGVEYKETAINLLSDQSDDPLTQERYITAYTNLSSQMLVAEARTAQIADQNLFRNLRLQLDEIDVLHQRISDSMEHRTEDRSQLVRRLSALIQRWLLQVEAVNAAIRLKTIQSDASLESIQRTSLTVMGYVLTLCLSIMAWLLNRWSRQQKTLQDREAFLHRMTEIDPLTGLLNRRGWERIRQKYDRQPDEVAKGLTLIMIDLDHFKRFNDQEGHAAGDQLLMQFARLLQSRSRPNDALVRLGGEEFLLSLPECDADAAQQMLDRLRAGPTLPITFSAGVAEVKVGELMADALHRADRALYRAKHLGRSRTCVAPTTG